ncbi:hypothetical protein BBJ28_00002235 [Nothophytophthora sp. Chile5]|nr:hypothetical protein BBJ28_00002235 [Nothophytophthora sp. Chile5]
MFAVFDYMLENGLNTTAAYTNTLGAASNSNQHKLMCEILRHMTRNSVDPSVQTYDTILKSCARDGDAKMALDLQRAMLERGLTMTESTYSSLIGCAVSADHWELAQDAMASMQSQGLEPTMRTYHLALVECLKRMQWDKAASIYEAMPQDVRAQLDGSRLRAVILGHANAESEELKFRAVNIFNDHKEKCNIDVASTPFSRIAFKISTTFSCRFNLTAVCSAIMYAHAPFSVIQASLRMTSNTRSTSSHLPAIDSSFKTAV